MAGFWESDDGSDLLEETDGNFDAGGGNMDPIPDNSNCLAAIDEIKWDEDQKGNEFISARWSVQQPEEYANRKVWHKLWVTDDDPKAKKPEDKRTKAKKMLAAIDQNAGGKLARKSSRPDDDDLALALIGKPMVIKLMIWEMDGKSGNWVSHVSPKATWAEKKAEKPLKRGERKVPADDLDDDSIPF